MSFSMTDQLFKLHLSPIWFWFQNNNGIIDLLFLTKVLSIIQLLTSIHVFVYKFRIRVPKVYCNLYLVFCVSLFFIFETIQAPVIRNWIWKSDERSKRKKEDGEMCYKGRMVLLLLYWWTSLVLRPEVSSLNQYLSHAACVCWFKRGVICFIAFICSTHVLNLFCSWWFCAY